MFNFPGEQQVMTVYELTRLVKGTLEGEPSLQGVMVEGEISNFYHHNSGHMYFTLKDDRSSLRCVMFRSSAKNLNFEPENGTQAMAYGSISVYPARGEYQLYVDELKPAGLGKLYIEFEKLKSRLEEEGLFAAEHKKPIPKVPNKVAVVTSATGAAIRDIISVIKRRFSRLDLLVAPALVQGKDAPASMVKALRKLKGRDDLDVVIIGRGGGSIEDLWAFNDEELAREIFAFPLPVISAVGHERDFTISDFVADLRAPTPSAAAELVVANQQELSRKLRDLRSRLTNNLQNKLSFYQQQLAYLQSRRVLKRPEEQIYLQMQKVDDLHKRLERSIKYLKERKQEKFIALTRQLEGLNPLATLNRGYSITYKDGQRLSRSDQVERGDLIRTVLTGGEIISKVEKVKEDEV
ncbi:MAG: exodeoxyribonuclease VII large subunit [Halanaerobium sp.]|nr:exodeoxyribonuclease VII large subunit [Halanaerobium sp.]